MLARSCLAACGGAEANEETIALVADVAHDPRQPVDDDPANQCEEHPSGEADHFVELDPEGNFIRSG